MVHSGYHPLMDRSLRRVYGWCTVGIILLRIVLLGECLDGGPKWSNNFHKRKMLTCYKKW